MKSVAIAGLALVGGAVARTTLHFDRHPSVAQPQLADDEFGIVNVNTDIQTVVMPGNSGTVYIGRDDADNELDMHFNVPNNRGNFEVNDYTVRRDADDDEFRAVWTSGKYQEGMVYPFAHDDADNELDMHFNVPNNRGNFQVNDYTKTHDDDEFGIVNVKTDIQTVVMPGNRGAVTIGRDDEADNELDMHFNVPNNRGNFEVNDYTVRRDADDDEFGIVDVKTDIQTVVMPGNRGRVTIGRDDEADNELNMHFNVPNNRGNFEVNDYTVRRDADDDEFGIVNVKTDIQTVVMPGNRGAVTIGRDDEADNELDMHFNVPNNMGNFQVNDYTVRKDAEDDEFGIVDVKTDIQTVVMPGNRGRVTIGRDDEDNELLIHEYEDPYFRALRDPRPRKYYMALNGKDDADNELDMHFNVPNNRGNFQVNDYTKTHDDDEFGIVDVKTDIQTVVMPGNRGHVTIGRDDEADNELDMTFNVPNNRGNFQVNDYTKTHDDEFVAVASNSKHLKKDEIDLLASILKSATQDKEGNVFIDGVKIAKIPKQETKKVELPKPKKFLAF